MMAKQETAILFICLGNICRSPLAQGVFAKLAQDKGLAERFRIDSAGIGDWHAGAPPDPRSLEIATRYGVNIANQRARQITEADFGSHDLIFGMDRSNVRDLEAIAPPGAWNRIHLLLQFATGRNEDIPDPYYGGPDGFVAVYRTPRDASEK